MGEVPVLKLINVGGTCILIIEGEELVGAKQNRIVNSTFLIPGKIETAIPVSCVEQGRWRHQSDKFRSGGKMKVSSPTEAMADVFERCEGKLDDYLQSFQIVELQVGAIFAINGQILGIECFWCHDTFRRFFDKFLKSFALDALSSANESETKSVEPAVAKRFLTSVAAGKGEEHRSVGIGTHIRIESRSVSGASLAEGDHVLHLSAFKKEGKKKRYSKKRELYIY